jgi:3-phenylpropionate/cinnamic acid dioxygenase small subunit
MSDRTADRLAIGELLASYAWAMCDRDWAAWQALFTTGAHVDYTTAGGVAGTPAEAAEWLSGTFAMFESAVSHVGNVVIDFTDDDSASVRSLYKMAMKIAGDPPTHLEACGWYRDRVVRTADGWRIADRFEQLVYMKQA